MLHDEIKEIRMHLGKAYDLLMKLENRFKIGGGVAPAPEEPQPPPSKPAPPANADLGQKTIKFGKHKGEKFDDLPAQYLDWLRDQAFVETSHPDLYAYLHGNADAIDEELEEDWTEQEHPF